MFYQELGWNFFILKGYFRKNGKHDRILER